MDAFYEAAKQLSPPVAAALAALEPGVATAVTEIRLRCQQPVALQTGKGTLYLTKSGHVRMCPASDSFITSFAEIQDCFYAVCGYSVHSVQHALTNGYVPLAGGHRAGVCGTAVLNSEGEIINVRRITSLNIRVAREVRDACPKEVAALLRDDATGGLLFAGPPACGKTTLLRGAARVLGNAGKLVAIVDERMELCPTCATCFPVTQRRQACSRLCAPWPQRPLFATRWAAWRMRALCWRRPMRACALWPACMPRRRAFCGAGHKAGCCWRRVLFSMWCFWKAPACPAR